MPMDSEKKICHCLNMLGIYIYIYTYTYNAYINSLQYFRLHCLQTAFGQAGQHILQYSAEILVHVQGIMVAMVSALQSQKYGVPHRVLSKPIFKIIQTNADWVQIPQSLGDYSIGHRLTTLWLKKACKQNMCKKASAL